MSDLNKYYFFEGDFNDIDTEAHKIIAQAKYELKREAFREEVEKEKIRIKTKKSFWDIIFPYKILFIKKEN